MDLVQQIEEFKEKAQRIQGLLDSKANKVSELQEILNEREDKARELEDILTEKQKKADEIDTDVKESVDHAMGRLDSRFDEFKESVNAVFDERIKDLEPNICAYIDESAAEFNEKIDALKNDVFEKIHDESVKNYRNTQANIKELSTKLEQVDEIESRVRGLKGLLGVTFTFSLITLAGMIVLILDKFGVINTFFG